MTGTGTAVDPYVADGLAIVVAPGAAVGDRFLIKPTSDAVSGLQLLVSDPAKVAAAAPIVSSAGASNIGSGKITKGEVLDASNPQLRSPVDITFISATEYQISGDPATYTYAAGSDIDVNGWRVQISGTPAAGDSFSVTDNTSGSGDNRNALKLADVLNQPVLGNGTTSLNAAVGQFVGDIGVKTNQGQASRDAQKIVYEESVDALQSISGVNLDEEAANLVRYQQANMAAAL
jgi:flagellar hook-associated protein 1 FlgK